MRIVIILGVLVVGLMAYVRFAPTDVATWHQRPDASEPGDTPAVSGFRAVRRIRASQSEVLRAVEQRALAYPRTALVAGSVDEGILTFQTRSRIWGFPDYTTVAVTGDLLVIDGRSRFGRSDHGVNKLRIEDWLETLRPLTDPL